MKCNQKECPFQSLKWFCKNNSLSVYERIHGCFHEGKQEGHITAESEFGVINIDKVGKFRNFGSSEKKKVLLDYLIMDDTLKKELQSSKGLCYYRVFSLLFPSNPVFSPSEQVKLWSILVLNNTDEIIRCVISCKQQDVKKILSEVKCIE